MEKQKNLWKVGFWIVLGLLVVISLYLLYYAGVYVSLSQQYCSLFNDMNDLVSLYNPDNIIEDFNCFV